jgi:hypothetical protein
MVQAGMTHQAAEDHFNVKWKTRNTEKRKTRMVIDLTYFYVKSNVFYTN